MKAFIQKHNQPKKPVTSNVAQSHMRRTLSEELKTGLIDTTSPHFGHDFSQVPVYSPATEALQTKLTINRPGDKYEQEADRISEQVMRMSEPQLQRACACGGDCPKCQAGQSDHEHDRLQPKRLQSGNLSQIAAPPIVHEALTSASQPLDTTTRSIMEQRFSHDFSHVRVHTNTKAAESAQAVNAHAYTVGQDIVFGSSQYSPNTSHGQRLLAHELTHVVQQNNGRNSLRLQRDDKDKSTQTPTNAQPTPLRIIFYQQASSATGSFKAHADNLAANLRATKLPYGGCQTDSKSIGSISCAKEENVLIRAANYAKCLQQKVDQVHVVGHVPSSGAACLSGGLDAENAKWYLATAKVVVHGCQGVSRFGQGTASILKQLPDASVYVHKASAEAGGPLDFYKVTTDPSSADPKTITAKIPNVTNEGIGFTPESVKQWAEEQLNTLKQAVKNKEQGTLRNIKDWITLPIFASDEAAVFANTILADSSGQIPQDIIDAAREFKKTWGGSQQSPAP